MKDNILVKSISSFNIKTDVKKWKVGVKKNTDPAIPRGIYLTPALKKNKGIAVNTPVNISI